MEMLSMAKLSHKNTSLENVIASEAKQSHELNMSLRGACDEAISRSVPPLKDGLPFQAFAFVGDRESPDTWLLPHHTRAVKKAAAGKIGYEHTVDWQQLEHCTLLLSRQGVDGRRVTAGEPGRIIAAARHLAGHYRKAGRQIPDALCVLI